MPTSAVAPWSRTPSWTRTSSSRRAPGSGWTRTMTGRVVSWCPTAASRWSARDGWCRSEGPSPPRRRYATWARASAGRDWLIRQPPKAPATRAPQGEPRRGHHGLPRPVPQLTAQVGNEEHDGWSDRDRAQAQPVQRRGHLGVPVVGALAHGLVQADQRGQVLGVGEPAGPGGTAETVSDRGRDPAQHDVLVLPAPAALALGRP